MTRSTARQIAAQLAFSMDGNAISADEAISSFFEEEHYASLKDEDELYTQAPDQGQLDYIRSLLTLMEQHLPEIDERITRYSDGWKISRITRPTLAILRCSICEICYMDDIPDSASANEAVELGKKYDSPKAAAFINGILGSMIREEKPSS